MPVIAVKFQQMGNFTPLNMVKVLENKDQNDRSW